jgi:hypothetical protein
VGRAEKKRIRQVFKRYKNIVYVVQVKEYSSTR